jgi:hypothetical protein
MKNRHLVIIVLGCIILWQSYMSRYGTDIVRALLWGGLIFIGFVLFIVTLIRNIIRFRKERRTQNFFTTYLILGFAIIISGIEYKNQYDLDKPSLLTASYDGDINGASIDFKNDSTFIFENSAVEMSDYTYGTYKISGNKITLDKNFIENIILTDQLEIRVKDPKHTDGIETDNYVYRIDKNGNAMVDETIFRVVADNRKQPSKLKAVN